MRGATTVDGLTLEEIKISIHAPHAGSDDFDEMREMLDADISIHAPHAGSDSLH